MPMDANRWNGCRYAPEGAARFGHVESWFAKLNDPEGRRALWVKATLRVPDPREHAGGAVAESWAIAFERGRPPRAAKHTVPLGAAELSALGLDLTVGRLRWLPETLTGGVDGVRHTFGFDLHARDPGPALAPLPHPRLYAGPFPSSKFVSPAPDARFNGSFTVDGVTTAVSNWRGMQGHNWGRQHAHRYAWGHCNQFDDHDDLWFEGVTAQVRLGPLLAPPLTILCVSHRGVRYVFNRVRDLARARGRFDFRTWRFEAISADARVEGELTANVADMAGLRYDNPHGPPTFCLNSKIASGHLRLVVGGRAPLVARTRAAALEIGTHSTDHGVPIIA